MQTAFFCLLFALCYTTVFAQVLKPYKPKSTTIEMTQPKALATTKGVIVDTIPKKARQYYSVDKSMYLKYLGANLNDSVKLKKADANDWNDYASAKAKLQVTLKNNPNNNVKDYIDVAKDFSPLELVERNGITNTAKVSLRQLIFNIDLVTTILNSPMINDVEPKLLGALIQNMETLCISYISPFVKKTLASRALKYPKILFQVVDKNNKEMKNVSCLLITPKVCRDISCKNCKAGPEPCEDQKIASIVEQGDYTFDCGNPKALDVAPGVYHLFVVGGNRIVGYQWATFDAGDVLADTRPKTVKIVLQ